MIEWVLRMKNDVALMQSYPKSLTLIKYLFRKIFWEEITENQMPIFSIFSPISTISFSYS